MTFTERLTDADLKDMQRMIGRGAYNFRVFIYGPVLLVLFSLGYIRRSNWTMVVALVAVYCVCLLYSLYSRQQAFSKRLERINAMRPDRVSFTNDGLQAEGPHGAASFLPWRSFKSWREGTRVILLERTEGKQIHILPVAQLSEMDRLSVRQFMQSHVTPLVL
jgi:hypothetical protein